MGTDVMGLYPIVIARRATARRGDPVKIIFHPCRECGLSVYTSLDMDSCLRRNDNSWIATEVLRPPRNDVFFDGY